MVDYSHRIIKLIQDVYKELKVSPLKEQSTLPPFDTIPEQVLSKVHQKMYIICYTGILLINLLVRIYIKRKS